jgi:Anti-sigma factor NepR
MSKTKPTDDRAPADAGLDPKAMEAIGRALQAHYDDLVKAPLPDRFHELIASLDAGDETSSQGGANASS